MNSLPKRMGESLKAQCRFLARPFLSWLPDPLKNRLPFLGRVGILGRDGRRLQFVTYGPAGKDRIALKLARRGLEGYEGETIRVFLPLARRARGIIDVGANTGLFALLAARENPRVPVLAFEPVPDIFDMLRENVRLNRLTNLEAVPIGLSDFVGETPFYISRTSGGIPTDSSARGGFRQDVREILLPTTTLDAFLEGRPVSHVDLLKIDTETTEFQVFRGAERTLKIHRPFVICEVLENVDHSATRELFESLDYRFFHITPGGLESRADLQGSLAVDHRNYLFAPREKATELGALSGLQN